MLVGRLSDPPLLVSRTSGPCASLLWKSRRNRTRWLGNPPHQDRPTLNSREFPRNRHIEDIYSSGFQPAPMREDEQFEYLLHREPALKRQPINSGTTCLIARPETEIHHFPLFRFESEDCSSFHSKVIQFHQFLASIRSTAHLASSRLFYLISYEQSR